MATSGDTSWELTASGLVYAAYRKLGYIAEGETLSTAAFANGLEALNALLAHFVTKGMPLWKRTTSTVTPSATSQVYTVTAGVKVAEVNIIFTGGAQWDLEEKSLYDFGRLPESAAAGVPVHYTVQPTLGSTVVSIWPLTSDTATIANATLQITYQKKFDGMITSTDSLDFPSFWQLPIIFKLASHLAPESGLPIQDRTLLKAEADEAIKSAEGYMDEDGSLFITPTRQ